jgi:hypothetical protein
MRSVYFESSDSHLVGDCHLIQSTLIALEGGGSGYLPLFFFERIISPETLCFRGTPWYRNAQFDHLLLNLSLTYDSCSHIAGAGQESPLS